jgi:hypothetical protein
MAKVDVVAYFKNEPKLDKAASEKAKRPIYVDRDVVVIRIPGDTNRTIVQPADHGRWETDPVTRQRHFVTFAERFSEQYARFKAGEQQTQAGTPLAELTFLTEAKRRELKALSVYTAEQLAGLEGNQLKALGQGGRLLKDQAQAYLDAASSGIDAAELAAQVKSQTSVIADLQSQIEALKAGSAAKTVSDAPTATDVLALADGNFMAFKAAAKKVLGDDLPKTKDEIVEALKAKRSPFEDYEDGDIRNWLDSAGHPVDTALSRAQLIARADEVNAELANPNKAA